MTFLIAMQKILFLYLIIIFHDLFQKVIKNRQDKKNKASSIFDYVANE